MTGLRKRNVLICLCLFALAFVVRLVVWQNNKAAIDGVQYGVTHVYKQDARLLVAGDFRTFLTGPDPPSDATIIMHPPGYPIFIAAVYALFGENESLRIVQMMLCSLAAVLIFFLAQRLFGEPTAIIAGVLTAMSPQFAYYSAIILPDELSVLPVIAAMYLLVRGWQEKRLARIFLCGFSLGLSCWLRSNALLLPVFLAVLMLIIFPKSWSVKPSAILLGAFVLAIAPITLRNFVVFHAFVPLSVGSGTTFIEGLGDIDTDGHHGMPITDEGVMEMDAVQFARPDYFGQMYSPDGISRERNRVATGLQVVKDDPIWFAGGVLKRGTMAFRMERVPVIEPTYDESSTTPATLYFLNVPLKLFQRLFITAIVLPLILCGALGSIRTADGRMKLLVLLTVPLYFFTVQPLVHTEYRYLLPATHLLIVLASVPIAWVFGRAFRSNVDSSPQPQ
jgi:4-amino-4-deoxy-L-arabinose transferase-like glycosyltransferase